MTPLEILGKAAKCLNGRVVIKSDLQVGTLERWSAFIETEGGSRPIRLCVQGFESPEEAIESLAKHITDVGIAMVVAEATGA